LLVDAKPAPRKALAGLLAAHLRGAGDPVIVTESASMADALEPPAGESPVDPWHVVILGTSDARSAHAAIVLLRDAGHPMPVIAMVPSVSPSTETEVAGWPDGVICTPRPARLATLVALVRSALARSAEAETPSDDFDLGPYHCAPQARTLTDRRAGTVIPLTEKEADILACLHAAEGPLPRDGLLAQVWGYDESIDTHTLETHIHRLRRKIEPNPRQPTLLVTDCGGYRLGSCPGSS